MILDIRRFVALMALLLGGLATTASAATTERNQWYWNSLVNLHIDNHGGLVGKGKSADEIAAMLKTLPVDIVQVSAYGADGAKTTYPSELLTRADLGDWDTMDVWKEAVQKAGKRFHVYINTRGLNVTKQHPDWVQRDAAGKGKGRNGGLDTCARPSADSMGYLESLLLPLLAEIMNKYRPDGIWVDGDHARLRTCYCRHCKAAWRTLTGQAEPPTDADHPDWRRWLALEQRRYDEYRGKMAEVIHRINPNAFYTSNHSWKKATEVFEKDDPRSAPDFADTISADLSHGQALTITRCKAMFLSAERNTPWDIMHLIYKPQEISRQRVLQQGAVALAHGGSWFLWAPGGDPLAPDAFARTRECAQFVRDRAAALGQSSSINPVAVLLSERAWDEERIGGRVGFAGLVEAQHWALMLEEACYGVDLANETDLAHDLAQYRLIVVPSQLAMSEATLNRLKQYASSGGTLMLTGKTKEDFLGKDSVVVASGDETKPLVLLDRLGAGRVFYVSTDSPPMPDYDGFVPCLMDICGMGPAVRLAGAGSQEHFLFSFRKRGGRKVVHLTDIGSRVNGVRKYEEVSQLIDDVPPVPEVTLQLPSPKPTSVSVVPATTTVAHTWQNGLLTVTLKNVAVHAALLIEASPETSIELLPVGVPRQDRQPLAHYAHVEGLEENFEIASRGQAVRLVGPYNLRSKGDTAVEVSDETASSGKYSLKFIDAPCNPAYMPMLCIKPKIRLPVAFSCDFKIEPGATVGLEFREQENRRQFPVGPSLTFSAKTGKIMAGRRELGECPVNVWFSVEVQLPVDNGAFYSLRIKPAQGPAMRFDKLPYENPKYATCGWIGITGADNEAARFFLDNLTIRRADGRPRTSSEGRCGAGIPRDSQPRTVGWTAAILLSKSRLTKHAADLFDGVYQSAVRLQAEATAPHAVACHGNGLVNTAARAGFTGFS